MPGSGDEYDALLGPTGLREAIAALAGGEDGAVFPVEARTYLASGQFRRELFARGVGITQGLSGLPGIRRIGEAEYQHAVEELGAREQRRDCWDARVEMGVSLAWALSGGELFLHTSLAPNTHGIAPLGERYYCVCLAELPPYFREPHPRITSVGGFNFDPAFYYAVVDLINRS